MTISSMHNIICQKNMGKFDNIKCLDLREYTIDELKNYNTVPSLEKVLQNLL